MKLIIPLSILFTSLLSNTLSYAACTPGTNLTVTKTDGIYIQNQDGTITDTLTGLMWQQCPLGLTGPNCQTGALQPHSWATALAAVNADTGNGYTDWRLPNKNELNSLVDLSCFMPAINTTIFPGTINNGEIPNALYWSSTPDVGTVNAWLIDFLNGRVFTGDRQNTTGYVRLVRGMDLVQPAPVQPPAPG
ncbi:hypothetical protein MNBD_GAMMA09-1878 [hydrothermal vent metagenome]|uniref:Lcl C-terminal domain-containing protein n=1 Tax=hydrothermal vent metagenome TaxID=652676 RepID=A0A3B0Y409_9ZZZZ